MVGYQFRTFAELALVLDVLQAQKVFTKVVLMTLCVVCIRNFLRATAVDAAVSAVGCTNTAHGETTVVCLDCSVRVYGNCERLSAFSWLNYLQ